MLRDAQILVLATCVVSTGCLPNRDDYEAMRQHLMDLDGDGHCAERYSAEPECDPPYDCDDYDAEVNLDQAEIPYNSKDDDCNAHTPDDDIDGDGFVVSVDCDDTNPDAYPGAEETWYDGEDQDCDGNDSDQDEDGYDHEQDCDDENSEAAPGLDEVCDLVDNDCDDHVDEGVDTWWTDSDGDGYGDDEIGPTTSCTPEAGAAFEGGDCDDSDPEVNAAAIEICNDGLDNDCSGGPGDCRWNSDLGPDDGDAVIAGIEPGDGTGGIVLADVDLNFDGLDDIIVAAQYRDHGDGGGDEGALFYFFGPVEGEHTTDAPDGAVWGELGEEQLGWSVAAGKELQDGTGLILVSVRSDPVAYLFEAAAGLAATTSHAVGSIGSSQSDVIVDSVATLGDINSDHYADFAGRTGNDDTLAPDDEGVVWVFAGPLIGVFEEDSPVATLIGESPGDDAGEPTLGGHDLDGDGLDDLVLGAAGSDRGGTNSGAVYVQHAPFEGTEDIGADAVLTGEQAGDSAGSRLDVAGDVNQDGYQDLLVGSPLRGDGKFLGVVHVALGPFNGVSSLAGADLEIGSEDEIGLGVSMVGPGDLDGDGEDDFVLGGPLACSADCGTSLVGAVGVFFGPHPSGHVEFSAADTQFMGTSAEAYAGIVLASGDSNGDGLSDLMITSFSGLVDPVDQPGTVTMFLGSGL